MYTDIPRNLPSQEMVIALINRDNNLMLSRSDVIVSNPRANPDPTLIEGTPAIRDTMADLLAVFGGDFKENTVITYRRLDAANIFGSVATVIRPKSQKNITDLLEDINNLYGLALSSEDIEDGLVDLSKLPVTVDIVFKHDNPAWQGSFQVIVERLPINLDDAILNRVLPVLRYPTGQSTLIQGDLYVYSKDFTDDATILVNVDFNTPLDGVLQLLNKYAKPDVWVMRSQAADFNLYNAEAIYNGPVVDTYSTRRGFTRLLVVQLDKLCSNMAGRLLFHYNA